MRPGLFFAPLFLPSTLPLNRFIRHAYELVHLYRYISTLGKTCFWGSRRWCRRARGSRFVGRHGNNGWRARSQGAAVLPLMHSTPARKGQYSAGAG